jgi:hypothetical protein
MKNKKKLGFTNKIFLSIVILSLAVTVFSCLLMWHTSDTSGLAYLIPSVFGELATITGFAIKKSEKENTKGGIIYDAALNVENIDDEPKG